MSFIRAGRAARFIPERLCETTEYLRNPSCGWYRIFPFSLEETADFKELAWSLNEEEALALAFVDIGAYRGTEIPPDALSRFEEILRFFEENGKEAILRVAYDREGRGMEREPEFFQTVLAHMRQIGQVVGEHRDNVLVAQGLFIGSWGEMHDSKFLSRERLRQLLLTWGEATGGVPVAVRTPQHWRMLHPEGKGTAAWDAARGGASPVGIFNDGMFGSGDDLGTYGAGSRETAGWEGKWGRREELAFLGRISEYVPYGGEAVSGARIGGREAVEELRLAKADYLNRLHDPARLGEWEKEAWREDGPWDGCGILRYIGCHLGYRLMLRGVSLSRKRSREIRIRVENTGFAPLRGEALPEVYAEFPGGRREKLDCGGNLGNLQPGETRELSVLPDTEIMEGAATLLFSVRRRRDGRVIFLANPSREDGRVCLGRFS